MTENPAAADTASLKTEAAKQAIALVFGAAFLVIAYFVQRKTGQDFAQAQREGIAPDFARTRRMTTAKRLERVYATAGSWALKAAELAWRKAEQARVAYESERA